MKRISLAILMLALSIPNLLGASRSVMADTSTFRVTGPELLFPNNIVAGANMTQETTNTVQALLHADAAAFSDALTIYVSTNGNDSTAVVGDPTRPYATLQAGQAQIVNGSTLKIGPGTFYYSGSFNTNMVVQPADLYADLLLDAVTNVTVSGSGPSTIFRPDAGTSWGEFINTRLADNILIENFVLYSENPAGITQQFNTNWSAINFYGTNKNITIQNIALINHARQGIAHLFGPRKTENVLIQNVYAENIGTTNISGVGGKTGVDGCFVSGIGSYWTVRDCYGTNILRAVEPQHNSPPTSYPGLRVYNNVFVDVIELGIAWFSSYHDVKIKDNVFKMTRPAAFAGVRGMEFRAGISDAEITGNLIESSNGNGMYTESGSMTNVLISRNIFRYCNAGMTIYDSGGGNDMFRVDVIDNTFIYGTNRAIQYSASDGRIIGNRFVDATTATSQGNIRLLGTCSNNIVAFNHTSSPGGSGPAYGIEFTASIATQVYGNDFADATIAPYNGTGTSTDFGYRHKQFNIGSGTPTDNSFIRYNSSNAEFGLEQVPGEIAIRVLDETTALTVATLATWRAPYAMTITGVRCSVTTAPTGTPITVDINENGSTILSTKLTIDATEKTSTTAAAAVISDSALADDSEITIDVDAIGSGTAGAGLKVWIIGTRN